MLYRCVLHRMVRENRLISTPKQKHPFPQRGASAPFSTFIFSSTSAWAQFTQSISSRAHGTTKYDDVSCFAFNGSPELSFDYTPTNCLFYFYIILNIFKTISDTEIFYLDDACKVDFSFYICSMAGMHGGNLLPGQILQYLVHDRRVYIQQVEASDYIDDSIVAADFFRILDRIANPGVAASRNDHDALFGFVSKGRIVHDMIRFEFPVRPFCNTEGGLVFKLIAPGNFAEVNQFFC